MTQRLDQLLQCCTVKITIPGQLGWGTGFFVAPGLILSCAHVVKFAQDNSVRVFYPQEGQSYLATLAPDGAASQSVDLALLRLVDAIAPHPCVYLNDAIALHDRLYSYGYPDDFAEGAFTTFESEALTGGNAFIKFKAGQVRPGMSGSPLLNQTTGKVCGIVKFTRDRLMDSGGGAIPATVIFEQFPVLREQQQQFHGGDRRWSELVNSIQRSSSPAQPRVWMVPASRNPFFTGRETLLAEMRASLLAGQPTAFCGLGGMGKTQTAIEYAYRHRENYETVLWVRAEQAGEFSSGLVEIAKALELPIAHERDETLITTAVKAWLKQHQNWLLVLDNADDLAVVQAFLRGIDTGHILLTSLAQATGAIKRIEIQKMAPEEGALFLLRRAKVIGEQEQLSAADSGAQALAVNIATQMDGLPLALDQAGAFIEETFTPLEDYLAFYEAEGVKLLEERGELTDDHPSITVTFSLAFEKVIERNLAAADLIRACAFLAQDAIPEELFREAAIELGEHLSVLSEKPLELVKVFAEASRFSLLYRNTTNRTFSIHRLVQQVLQARMSPNECCLWAERIVRSLNRIFPEPDYLNWSLCDCLLPHARVAAALVELYQFQFEAVGELFDKTGNYLLERGQYVEAEPLFQTALILKQQLLGQDHPNVASSLGNLALLYHYQDRHNEAEPLYLEALKLRQQLLGQEHLDIASSLVNLANLYLNQGRYGEAEPLLIQALELRQQRLTEEHPAVAHSLGDLALLYVNQGRYSEAEPLQLQSLELKQRVLGAEHPSVITSLNNLGLSYHYQARYSEAEPFYLKALELARRILGEEHPSVATSLNNLASLYKQQGRYSEAESLCLKALELGRRVVGEEHSSVVASLNNLSGIYFYQKCYSEAELYLLKALELARRILGEEHPSVATSLNNLALLYKQQGRYSEAESLCLKALELRQRVLGEEHPHVGRCFDDLGMLQTAQGQQQEAEASYLTALEILERRLGAEHSWTVRCRENLEQLRNRSG